MATTRLRWRLPHPRRAIPAALLVAAVSAVCWARLAGAAAGGGGSGGDKSEGGAPPVKALTSATWAAALTHSDKPWLVEFYAPWCGHCQHLLPKFEAVAREREHARKARFGSINCEDHGPVCKAFGVDGYPVVLYLPPRTAQPASPAAGTRYRGPRTAEGLRDFITRMTRPALLTTAATDGSSVGVPTSRDAWQQWLRTVGREGVAFVLVHDSPPDGTGDAILAGVRGVAEALRTDATFVHMTPGQAAAGAHAMLSSTAMVDAMVPILQSGTHLLRFDASTDAVAMLAVQGPPCHANTHLPVPHPHIHATTACVESSTPTAAEVQAVIMPWVQRFRMPDWVEVSPDNFAYLARNDANQLLVLVVTDGEVAGTAAGHRAMPSASRRWLSVVQAFAKDRSDAASVRESFLFAVLDGNTHTMFVQQYGVTPNTLPALLVVDMPTERAWLAHNTSGLVAGGAGTTALRQHVHDHLRSIIDGTATMQRAGMWAYPQAVVNVIGYYPALGVGVLAACAIVWFLYHFVIRECIAAFAAPDGAPARVDDGPINPSSAARANKASRPVVATSSNRPHSGGVGRGGVTTVDRLDALDVGDGGSIDDVSTMATLATRLAPLMSTPVDRVGATSNDDDGCDADMLGTDDSSVEEGVAGSGPSSSSSEDEVVKRRKAGVLRRRRRGGGGGGGGGGDGGHNPTSTASRPQLVQ